MLDINKYLGKKVYIQIDTPATPQEETDPDEVKGEILLSIDEVLATAEPEDEFIEVELSRAFIALDKCVHLAEVRDDEVVARIPTKVKEAKETKEVKK